MKVSFYLDSKPSQSGRKAIWCYIREKNKTLAINTEQSVLLEYWDKSTHRTDPHYTKDKIIKGSLNSINQFLNAFEAKIYDIVRGVRSKDFSAGFNAVTEEIKKQFNRKDVDFFAIYDEFLSIKRLKVTKQSLIKLKRIKTLLEEYQKANRERLDFEKVTPLFLSKFYSFLINEKNMLNNTANKNMQFFKSFLIWANDNNFTDNNSYRSFKSKTEQTEIIFLTEAELMKLYNLKLDDTRLDRVRDLFVFQCFTGVRHSDIRNISREDINRGTWQVRTQKTHQIIEIPLNSLALSILAKYREFPQPLPVISNQKMNSYLKELCEIAGINDLIKTTKYQGSERIVNTYKKYEVIGTHTARRTFISLSLRKGMKPDVIMRITGHTTYRMMAKYLKIDDEHIREEMNKTWGSSLKAI